MNKLKDFVIEDGVLIKYKGSDAEVVIPDDVTTIDDGAFISCSDLVEIVISDSVTSIGESAFRHCIGLKKITIPDRVTSIGSYAFSNCTSLTSVTIPEGVISIGRYAFSDCRHLTEITIPDSVTKIGYGVFSNCESLKNITIPKGVTFLAGDGLAGCQFFESISVDSNNMLYDSRNNCNAIIKTSTNTLIAGCKNTVIPDNITSIGNCAFYQCTSLKSIAIPDGVTYIKQSAFYGCSGLTEIIIPDSVSYIGISAFEGCENLKKVIIGNGTRVIEDRAFQKCSNLTEVVFGNNIKKINTMAFAGCKLTEINLPDGIESVADNAFGYNAFGCSYKPNNINISENSKAFINPAPAQPIQTVQISIDSSKDSFNISSYEDCLKSFKDIVDINLLRSKNLALELSNSEIYRVEGINPSVNKIIKSADIEKIFKDYPWAYKMWKKREGKGFTDAHFVINGNPVSDIIPNMVAIRLFVDPDFGIKIRVFRSKWEERGDYPGISPEHVPPAVFWEISNKYPYGQWSYCPYKGKKYLKERTK